MSTRSPGVERYPATRKRQRQEPHFVRIKETSIRCQAMFFCVDVLNPVPSPGRAYFVPIFMVNASIPA
jgi:hypothetical protein